MDLRYRLAVVTGAGAGPGREIAVALSRVGAAVLAVDRELDAAEATAALVREARVSAWSLQVDLAGEDELRLVAARARDLGGMDLLVTHAGGLRTSMRLTQLFLDGLPERRGRRDGTPAVVNIGSGAGVDSAVEHAAATAGLVRFTTGLADPASTAGARVMAIVPGRIGLERDRAQRAAPRRDGEPPPPVIPPAALTGVVVELLCRGTAGEVVELTAG